jgi:hypothetical protein
MSIPERASPINPAPTHFARRPVMRAFSWDRDGSKRRAAAYAAELAALRNEAFAMRCRLDRAPDDMLRALLAWRLDAADHRAADLRARMIEARS